MAVSELIVEIRVSWWVPVYLEALGFFCCVMRAEPDLAKVLRTVERGMRIKANGKWQKLTA